MSDPHADIVRFYCTYCGTTRIIYWTDVRNARVVCACGIGWWEYADGSRDDS